jgi:uncharacterized protein
LTTSLEPDRIFTLDLIRGVAVMGILAMNIVGFTLPESAYSNPLSYGIHGAADRWSWLLDFLLVDGKMRGLFSFLFGASMLLVIQRADAAGQPSERIHFARMAWLLVFGLLHFYLIWWGDILSLYAIVGMVAWFFIYQSPAALLRRGLLLVLAQTIVELTTAQPPASDPITIANSLNLYRSGFADIAAHRLGNDLLYPLASVGNFGWETLGYMLFGMAALKAGFLSGNWPRRRYAQIAVFGLGIGLPIYAVLAVAQINSDFSADSVRYWNFAATTLVRPPMILAYAALIILLGSGRGALTRRIAAAGRAAFTNYLGTSLIMTFLFYGWGLGWFGTLGRAQLWLVVLPMWALMLLWSKPWLDRFRYGPFEWLWRSLARGKPQPMRIWVVDQPTGGALP